MNKFLLKIVFWSYLGFFICVILTTWIHMIVKCFNDKHKINKEKTEKNLGRGQWISYVVRIIFIVVFVGLNLLGYNH